MTSSRGVALVLAAGLLSLLTLLASAVARLASVTRGVSSARGAAGAAERAGESGMEYAAARLAREGYPRHLDTPGSRCDGWTAREPAGQSPQASLNPSYARGEPWSDSVSLAGNGTDDDGDGLVDEPGEGNGLFTPGESWTDLDGDGRYSAWTGRLRDGTASFALRIGSSDGKIPLNAGLLHAADVYGPNGAGTNGQDDHNDRRVPYHAGLAHALNNLAVVCDLATKRWSAKAGNPGTPPEHWIQAAWLGNDLIDHRPVGGYRSSQEVRDTLQALGYQEWERDRVLPFLDLGPYQFFPGLTRNNGGKDDAGFAPYASVNLSTAPREVLVSLWMYVMHRRIMLVDQSRIEPSSLSLTRARRTGPPGLPLQCYRFVDIQRVFLYPEEAERIADLAIRTRQTGMTTWKPLQERFIDPAEIAAVFREDFEDLAAFPLLQHHWTRAKAELALQAVTSDPFPYQEDGQLTAWAAGGVFPPAAQACFLDIQRVFYPASPFAEYQAPIKPYETVEIGQTFGLQGLSTAPPTRYEIRSWGSADGSRAGTEGTLWTAEILEFTSQEDFENLSGGAALARMDLATAPEDETVWTERHDRLPPLEVPDLEGGSPFLRTQNRVVTLPRWNRRAVTDETQGIGARWGFSRTCGAISLAGRETGLQGARLYWPFKDDFDGRPNNDQDGDGDPDPEEWTGNELGDFWHEMGLPAWGFPPEIPLPGLAADAPYDRPALAPHQVSAETWESDAGFPGYRTPWGTRIVGSRAYAAALRVEAWMSPQGFIQLRGEDDETTSHFRIELTASRKTRPDLSGETVYLLELDFWICDPDLETGTSFQDTKEWSVADGNPARWARHVTLVAKGPEDPFAVDPLTWRLFIDGAEQPGSLQSPPFWPPSRDSLSIEEADEVKLYDTVPDDPALAGAVRQRFEQGRFVRSGTYVSPRYLLPQAARFGKASWNGLIPPGFPAGSLRAVLEATDASGTDHALDLSTPGTLVDASSLPAARSFRYRVLFDCESVPEGEMRDTPVFESIRLALQRRGRSPAWTEWR